MAAIEDSLEIVESFGLLASNQSSSPWKCPKSFWTGTNFDECHVQRYLELTTLGSALIVVLLVVIIASWSRYTDSNSNSAELSSLDGEETELENNDASFIIRPKNRSTEAAFVVVCRTSISDRIWLIAECLISVIIAAASIYNLQTPRYIYAPSVPLLRCVLSIYVAFLAFLRLYKVKMVSPSHLYPFLQCVWLYTLGVALQFLDWLNLSIDNSNEKTASFVMLALSVARWLLIASSTRKDEATMLYHSPGAPPSWQTKASLLRSWFCCWSTPLIFLASRKPLEIGDVWELEEGLHAYAVVEKYQKTRTSMHYIWRIVSIAKFEIFLNLTLGIIGAGLTLAPVAFVNLLLGYMETKSVPKAVAWLYVFGIALSQVLLIVVENQAYYLGRRLSVSLRAVLMNEIYHKALYRELNSSKTEDEDEAQTKKDEDEQEDEDKDAKFDAANSGSLLNLMSVDTFKIAEFIAYLHPVLASPMTLVIAIVYLYSVLSWSSLAGITVMLLSLPVSYAVSRKLADIEEKLMAVTDKRMGKTNELLSAIRIIKYFAWERNFANQIYTLREKELHLVYLSYLWWCCGSIIFYILPSAFTAVSFASWVLLQKRELTSSVAFTTLAVFNILRYPLDDISYNISRYATCKVSVRRISEFLEIDETPKYEQLELGSQTTKFGLENVTASWHEHGAGRSSSGQAKRNAFSLRDINVTFKPKALNVIIGPTGSGKTSLLMALLGEMPVVDGQLYLPAALHRRLAVRDPETGLTNSVAFCAQQAWLLNDTVRANIVFSAPFNRARYNAVIEACELKRDFAILKNGDQTKIGDRGIALSGGQKQRVALARAFYSDSQILLLDDCLSAVDSHTAEALYKNALGGPLAQNRTIVLVSHNVPLAVSQAAYVVSMKNGRVDCEGDPIALAASGKLGDDALIHSAHASDAEEEAEEEDIEEVLDEMEEEAGGAEPAKPCDNAAEAEEEDDDDAETKGLGSIKWTTYARYINALGGKSWWICWGMSKIALPVTQYLNSWWLKHWTADILTRPSLSGASKRLVLFIARPFEQQEDDPVMYLSYYLGIYILIGFGITGASMWREILGFSGSIRASRKLFSDLLESIIHAKVRFFDATPTGRITNRFSKDIECVDQETMRTILILTYCALDALSVVTVVGYYFPVFFPVVLMLVYCFKVIGQAYLNASRELKRLESISRSPIFQHFGEVVGGSITVRAYGETDRFIDLNRNVVDTSHRPYLFLWLANRWLALSSALVSTATSVTVAAFLVARSDRINAGLAGLALSYTMLFGDSILWCARMYSEVELAMNSVERIEEYACIEPEAPVEIPENKPPPSWPQHGAIEFKDLSLRYAEKLPLVIKNVSFSVEPGMKVGIVGRTGAGKSTIITALFRMLEPANGTVIIDGIDITTLGLHDLRSSLSIIPQDPTLFQGTLRSNLDPFDEHTDEAIFKSLARVHLVPENVDTQVQHAEGENANKFLDLESEILEGGTNLSQGQRQLLCLARSLLKAPKILLLDEATASIDYDTDKMVQTTIRQQFEDTTILTIAHRLRTIADYDKIVVLEHGELVQCGTPAELLADEEGIFYGMCARSGELDALKTLAGMHP